MKTHCATYARGGVRSLKSRCKLGMRSMHEQTKSNLNKSAVCNTVCSTATRSSLYDYFKSQEHVPCANTGNDRTNIPSTRLQRALQFGHSCDCSRNPGPPAPAPAAPAARAAAAAVAASSFILRISSSMSRSPNSSSSTSSVVAVTVDAAAMRASAWGGWLVDRGRGSRTEERVNEVTQGGLGAAAGGQWCVFVHGHVHVHVHVHV